MNFLLLISLFFPWMSFEYLSRESTSHSAFSAYVGYVGYGIMISVILIPFFLLSHHKKEHIRSLVPFRLSDTQAIVFIGSMLLTALLHTIFLSPVFAQFSQESLLGNGFLIAISATIIIILSSFFLSKSTKEQAREMRFLDHHDTDMLSEYQTIIDAKGAHEEAKNQDNMKLPI